MKTHDATLTTDVVSELLAETDVPTLVRRVRPLAVRARLRPLTVTRAEVDLLVDLARIRLNDAAVPGVPATAVPALVATLTREHPDLDDREVHRRARAIAQHALTARADALAADLTRSSR